jgi:hypothetical protein
MNWGRDHFTYTIAIVLFFGQYLGNVYGEIYGRISRRMFFFRMEWLCECLMTFLTTTCRGEFPLND